jgi:hypothetical protein
VCACITHTHKLKIMGRLAPRSSPQSALLAGREQTADGSTQVETKDRLSTGLGALLTLVTSHQSRRLSTVVCLAASAVVALGGEAFLAARLVVIVAAAELEALPLVHSPVVLAPVKLLCICISIQPIDQSPSRREGRLCRPAGGRGDFVASVKSERACTTANVDKL